MRKPADKGASGCSMQGTKASVAAEATHACLLLLLRNPAPPSAGARVQSDASMLSRQCWRVRRALTRAVLCCALLCSAHSRPRRVAPAGALPTFFFICRHTAVAVSCVAAQTLVLRLSRPGFFCLVRGSADMGRRCAFSRATALTRAFLDTTLTLVVPRGCARELPLPLTLVCVTTRRGHAVLLTQDLRLA
eukprot:918217-Rhodomonas_salina.1